MWFLVGSAAFVGLVHSLAPGHWLPVVLIAKVRRWTWKQTLLGAWTVASGHIFISLAIGGIATMVGAQLVDDHESAVERYSSLLLALLGLGFAAQAYFRHSHCGDAHSHHGPEANSEVKRSVRKTAVFLFSLGFSPCIAVLPVFGAAIPYGGATIGFAMLAFSIGVLVAISLAALLGRIGTAFFDHPIFEHYSDVVTGLGIALVGLGMFVWTFFAEHGGHG